MASEILKIDANNKSAAGFVTDDSNQFIRNARIDDTTKGLKVMIVGGTGSGTVTSITQGTGILLTPSPITTTGSVTLATAIAPIATLGSANQSIRVNAGATALEYYTPSSAGLTIGTTTITSGTNTRILYDNSGVLGEYTLTGSGTVVAMATSPAFTTPSLGVATATSINGNTFTTGTYTLTGQAGKTLTFNGSITLTGTDAQTYTFPTTSATIARTDAANTFTGTQTVGALVATTVNGNTITTGSSIYTGTAAQTYTFPTTTASIARTDAAQTFTGTQTFAQVITTANAITASSNAATIPVTSRHNIVTNSSAATLTITLTTASAVNMQTCVVQILDFSAAAQTLTFVNTENSTVTVPATTNGSTTLPLTVGFMYNSATSKWRCLASA